MIHQMRKNLFSLVFLFAVVAAALVLYANPPGNNKYYPPCVFKKMTGYDCAGCGSTRACYHLLHGNMKQAANHNSLLLLLMPVMAIGLAHTLSGRLSVLWQKINKPLFFLILLLIFWVTRNIPIYPLYWLHSDK